MKTLLILRHAKSSHDHPGITDHDRPLNKRDDAMRDRSPTFLKRKDIVPDRIICSTATRAAKLPNLCCLGFATNLRLSIVRRFILLRHEGMSMWGRNRQQRENCHGGGAQSGTGSLGRNAKRRIGPFSYPPPSLSSSYPSSRGVISRHKHAANSSCYGTLKREPSWSEDRITARSTRKMRTNHPAPPPSQPPRLPCDC